MADPKLELQQAVALIRDGQTDQARPILQRIVAADPTQESAWLWLATIAANNEERLYHLEQALALNPANPTAQAAYTQIVGRPYTTPTAVADIKPASPVSFNRVLLVMVGLIFLTIVGAVLIFRQDDSSDKKSDLPPTMSDEEFFMTLDAQATETINAIPLATSTFTMTPHPTFTPGPSPTPITPVTPRPTWTPTFTPTPTYTPTITPTTNTPIPTDTATATETATATDTQTPLPPSESPESLSTLTPRANTRTQTAVARTAQPITLTATP